MNKTSMPHVDYTWNPFTGCTFGCEWCYARAVYKRFGKSFEPRIHFERFNQPKKLKKPSLIFCGSAGDIVDVPALYFNNQRIVEDDGGFVVDPLRSIYTCLIDVMNETPQHQYLLLTKRPHMLPHEFRANFRSNRPGNLWLGTSVTNQEEFDRRVGDLMTCKPLLSSPKRMVLSIEPMLGPVDISEFAPYLSWVIVGSKSPGKWLHDDGEKHDWLFDLINQCEKYNVPLLYKHGGKALASDYNDCPFIDYYGQQLVQNPMQDALNKYLEEYND